MVSLHNLKASPVGWVFTSVKTHLLFSSLQVTKDCVAANGALRFSVRGSIWAAHFFITTNTER